MPNAGPYTMAVVFTPASFSGVRVPRRYGQQAIPSNMMRWFSGACQFDSLFFTNER